MYRVAAFIFVSVAARPRPAARRTGATPRPFPTPRRAGSGGSDAGSASGPARAPRRRLPAAYAAGYSVAGTALSLTRRALPERRQRSGGIRLQRVRQVRLRAERRGGAADGDRSVSRGTAGRRAAARAGGPGLLQHGQPGRVARRDCDRRRRVRSRAEQPGRSARRADERAVLGYAVCWSAEGLL